MTADSNLNDDEMESNLISLDSNSLLNMMRHAWLMGYNSGHLKDDIDSEEYDKMRTGFLEEILVDQLKNGYTCYGDSFCSHQHD